MFSVSTDTIAAAATGPANGGIGIIRISGARAVQTASALFFPYTGSLEALSPARMTRGAVKDADGRMLDDAMCVIFRAPASYTGEDCVELHCHGGVALIAEILDTVYQNGARPAKPGEFTRRAFQNGKMDLSEAEAVADLIGARTPAAMRNAAGQLSGIYGDGIRVLRDGLTGICAHFTAMIDYPEEDVEPLEMTSAVSQLENAAKKADAMRETHKYGAAASEGVDTVITGKPNTGKSSLLNALSGFERSIVTGYAGTTRDIIEHKIVFGSLMLNLKDTAGLREDGDEIERIGIDRAHAALADASLIIAVFDGSCPLDERDRRVINLCAGREAIAVINKCDLTTRIEKSELYSQYSHICEISAKTGENIESIKTASEKIYNTGNLNYDGGVVTNARHADALLRFSQHCRAAASAANTGMTADAVWSDIDCALSALGEITGETVKENVLSAVFERFCVGK